METTVSVKTLEFRKLQTFEVAGIIFTVVYFRYILLYSSLYFHLLHFFLTPQCCSMRVISLWERQALMILVNLALYIILVQISYMLTDCVDQSTGFVQTFFFFQLCPVSPVLLICSTSKQWKHCCYAASAEGRGVVLSFKPFLRGLWARQKSLFSICKMKKIECSILFYRDVSRITC